MNESNNWEQELTEKLKFKWGHGDGLLIDAHELFQILSQELAKARDEAIQEGYNRGRIKAVEQSELRDIILKAKEHGREEGRQEGYKQAESKIAIGIDNLKDLGRQAERERLLKLIEEMMPDEENRPYWGIMEAGQHSALESLKEKIGEMK